MISEYRALVVTEKDNSFVQEIKSCSISELPKNDVIVKVSYSSLNFKDALSATGNKGVTRTFPHTPGIDAVGTVVTDKTGKFNEGDSVIVTSYDLGMNTFGGFGEYISVPAEWIVALPNELTMKEAMTFGTAGFTAAISVFKLVQQVSPEDGSIAVSGATGGVGSLAIMILSKLGYSVTAISGKESESEYLKKIGATEIISREEFQVESKRPILKGLFAGAVDTVGGAILENIIKSTAPLGVVTCCGNAASPKLELTVFPFILRGVSLIGIDSQNCPMELRVQLWNKLANEWKPESLDSIATDIVLDELPEAISTILAGKVKGRYVVEVK